MFSGIRQNSTVYILEKGENPTLKVAQVEAISQPKPKYGTNPYQFQPETVVDMKVKEGDNILEFQNLPSNQCIATYNANVVISESRDAMLAEVESMERTSTQVLESVPYHQSVVKACKQIQTQLNPQLAKEQQQAERIDKMEEKIDKMFEFMQTMSNKTV